MSHYFGHMASAENIRRKQNFDSVEYLPTHSTPHCRICLQQTGQMIQLPCACIGEMGLVHQQCFAKWVQTLRNDPYQFNRRVQSTASLSDSYQVPCEICKAKIKILMHESRACVGCKDIKKPEVVFAIFCILFNLGILAVVSYFCIKSIINSSDSGLRIFINVFIMFIMYLILGWIIKKQSQRLLIKSITSLQIVLDTARNNQDNQIVNFVVEEEIEKKTDSSGNNEQARPGSDIDPAQTSERRKRRRRANRL